MIKVILIACCKTRSLYMYHIFQEDVFRHLFKGLKKACLNADYVRHQELIVITAGHLSNLYSILGACLVKSLTALCYLDLNLGLPVAGLVVSVISAMFASTVLMFSAW